MEEVIKDLLFSLADEVVTISKEESNVQWDSNGVPRRSLLQLLQKNNVKVVSHVVPSESSTIVQPKVLKQKKNGSCGYAPVSS